MHPTAILIVNYRTADLVVRCLASIAADPTAPAGLQAIVVDNDSRDGSVERLDAQVRARGWGNWVSVHALPKNGGFAYGNNRALERARDRMPGLRNVVLLNPDTEVRPAALATLLAALHAEPSIGIVGASIENEHGAVEVSAHRWPSPLGELEGAARFGPLSRWLAEHAVSPPPRQEPHDCEWVSGACMAVKTDVFDRIGPMDEGYFLYFEEVDFCRRAVLAGWRCRFEPRARIVHLEGAATGIRTQRVRRPGYWYDSRRRFLVKAHGVGGLAMADLAWALGRASLVVRRALGLGGRAGRTDEPRRWALDLLGGDLRAALRRDLMGARRAVTR
jgi:GT2 family glycosyltransferase